MDDEQQDLVVEIRIKVSSPRIAAAKLATGISKLITRRWPECPVKLDDVHIISVANADLKFYEAIEEGDEDEQQEET